jgi:probable HAF family extracellular repeat protein
MNRRLWLSALSLTLVAPLVRSASAVSIYQVTDLGTLGGTASVARAINDRGQVVGESTINSGENHAFIWENGRMRDLGLFPGDLFAAASDINNRGQVVGAGAADFSPHALLWENGRVIDLGGTFSQAFAINNRGQIVGVTSGGAALWQNGVLHNLANLSGGGSEAFDINDKGVIVGYSTTATGESHAVMWTDGGIVDLGTLPGDDFSQALAINSQGQIVGTSSNISQGVERAFIWENGAMRELGSLPTLPFSRAFSINELSQAAGVSILAGVTRATLFQKGSATQLPGLTGEALTFAYAINNLGQLVGASDFSAVLWTRTGEISEP